MKEVIIEIEVDSRITENRKKELERTVESLLSEIDGFKICSMRWRKMSEKIEDLEKILAEKIEHEEECE